MVLHPELRVIDAFAGYGGFSLAFQLAGVPARTVAYIERDAHAAATLVARMEDTALDRAPVWSDIVTFDGVPWRGRVDCFTAGFNCQPWSAAGQKRGLDDERWLWPHIARIIAEVGPSLVFLENVQGLNRGADGGGLSFILQDLADLGFDAEWSLLSAAEVGAPHIRERLWILAAYVGDAGSPRRPEVPRGSSGDEGADGRGANAADVADRAVQALADPDHEGVRGNGIPLGRPFGRAGTPGSSQDVGDAQSPGLQEFRHTDRPQLSGSASPGNADVADSSSVDEREPHHGTCAVPRRYARDDFGWSSSFPPKPDDEEGWQRWISAGGPQPSLRRVPDGTTGRMVKPAGIVDRLHLLGNGLVPLAAAHAFLQLSERLLSGRSG